mgnify:CR=1 FL=1
MGEDRGGGEYPMSPLTPTLSRQERGGIGLFSYAMFHDADLGPGLETGLET